MPGPATSTSVLLRVVHDYQQTIDALRAQVVALQPKPDPPEEAP